MADTNTTWKQVVYDAADAYRTASATTANVKVGELAQKISTLEDVTAEVTTQTPLIEDIIEALETKGITPTNGIYIWQRTSENTTEYVVSDDPSAYPDDGEQGGFTYKKIQVTEITEITPTSEPQTIEALTLLLNELTIGSTPEISFNDLNFTTGTITPSIYSTSSITITHGLGVSPRLMLVFLGSHTYDSYQVLSAMASNMAYGPYFLFYYYSPSFSSYENSNSGSISTTTTTATLSVNTYASSARFGAKTYYWIAFA